jgi:hypothetical protein
LLHLREASPRRKAKLAGVFYLLTIVTGALAAVFTEPAVAVYGAAANLAATVCYLAVTLLFYDIFKPVSKSFSLLAALFSFAGCAMGALSSFHIVPIPVSNLVFFGFYCLLIGWLIFQSSFLPKPLGALMALAGLGWLTFLSPSFANSLSPYNMAAGLLGEGSLTVWLLVVGVNVPRWKALAGAA